MAYGTPVDYSYSPSGSTDKLIDLATTRPSTRLSPQISSRAGSSPSWHPKLTLYRLLVIVSTIGLAAAKTATSLHNFNFASITLELILGVVVFLCFHILGEFEGTNSRYFAWLFRVDCMEYLWTFLENLTSFKRPYYISDEIDIRHQTMGIDPFVTKYRIIVTVVVASFGMIKSGLLYGQETKRATIVECVFGVGIATGLYCLGLYEASSIKVYPTLFHVDYSGTLSDIAIIMFRLLSAISTLFLFFGAFYGFYHLNEAIGPFSAGLSVTSDMGIVKDFVIKALTGCLSFYFYFMAFLMFLAILAIPATLIKYLFEACKYYFTVDLQLVDAPV